MGHGNSASSARLYMWWFVICLSIDSSISCQRRYLPSWGTAHVTVTGLRSSALPASEHPVPDLGYDHDICAIRRFNPSKLPSGHISAWYDSTTCTRLLTVAHLRPCSGRCRWCLDYCSGRGSALSTSWRVVNTTNRGLPNCRCSTGSRFGPCSACRSILCPC